MNMCSSDGESIFLTQSKLNDCQTYKLRPQSNISFNSLLEQQTTRTTGEKPECIAGARKIQTESESISLKLKCRLVLECKFL